MENAPEKCPCCLQPLPRERSVRLTVALVRALDKIVQRGGDRGYVDVPGYIAKGSHAKLKYWCFLEVDPSAASGRWKVTALGLKFLEGRMRPPEFAVVLQDHVVRYVGPRVKWNGSALVAAPDPPAAPPVPRQEEMIAAILADG